MKKSYSLIKIFEGVRSMSDLTWAIARLKEILNTLPNDAKMYMAFAGSSFDLVFELEPKDKDDSSIMQSMVSVGKDPKIVPESQLEKVPEEPPKPGGF